MPIGTGEDEMRECAENVDWCTGDIGGGEPGHLGCGYDTCGPRVPRIPDDAPNIGDIGVERPDAAPNAGLFDGPNELFVWFVWLLTLLKAVGWARGPEIMGGGECTHGNGGW